MKPSSTETGRFVEQTTHQGWSGDSTWTRGLAWALYGFTAVHRLSGEAEFLEVARRCADCYLRRSPPALVPPWDFDLPPDVPHLYDSSAAAIAASGLWDLSEAVTDAAEQDRYRSAALTILQTLCGDEFLPRRRPDGKAFSCTASIIITSSSASTNRSRGAITSSSRRW